MTVLDNSLNVASRQCSYSIEQGINAPLEVVWSLVRQFHNPKAYKMFIRSCSSFDFSGTFRNITHVTGFPATTSIERLDSLDDDTHVMVVSLVGGDHSHRLANYQGTISMEEDASELVFGTTKRTVVTEKYTVDVPHDICEEDTRFFVATLVGLNLKSLARTAESMMIT